MSNWKSNMRVGLTAGAAAAAAYVALAASTADAWTHRWDHSKRFMKLGHTELECDGQTQPASCCICQSIVHEIETQLNNTKDDYELDVVFRISEEKKKIKFSRSEARILEVLDSVCDRLPLTLPESTKKTQRLLADACTSFVGIYEDELTHVFFNDYSPAKYRACATDIQERMAEGTKEDL